jgi:hypothetical protein
MKMSAIANLLVLGAELKILLFAGLLKGQEISCVCLNKGFSISVVEINYIFVQQKPFHSQQMIF